MSFLASDSIIDSAAFICSLCGTHHIAIEKDNRGLLTIPSTITTSRGYNQEYYFHCAICPKNIGKGVKK